MFISYCLKHTATSDALHSAAETFETPPWTATRNASLMDGYSQWQRRWAFNDKVRRSTWRDGGSNHALPSLREKSASLAAVERTSPRGGPPERGSLWRDRGSKRHCIAHRAKCVVYGCCGCVHGKLILPRGVACNNLGVGTGLRGNGGPASGGASSGASPSRVSATQASGRQDRFQCG